jgi:hypothetical protein
MTSGWNSPMMAKETKPMISPSAYIIIQ